MRWIADYLLAYRERWDTEAIYHIINQPCSSMYTSLYFQAALLGLELSFVVLINNTNRYSCLSPDVELYSTAQTKKGLNGTLHEAQSSKSWFDALNGHHRYSVQVTTCTADRMVSGISPRLKFWSINQRSWNWTLDSVTLGIFVSPLSKSKSRPGSEKNQVDAG